jgi:hydrogenase expression/formation protein HypC
MCLAVPGRLAEWIEREPPFAEGIVEFAGVRRRTNLACVPDVVVGDFVLVHAGIAISRIDADEAERILKTLDEIEFEQLGDKPESMSRSSEDSP